MRHAYMIMAHNQVTILKLLISKLDCCDNDIIIHIDKKSNIDLNDIKQSAVNANLYFVDRLKITWGGVSQIICELNLLKKAREIGSHCYYHLLTGVDLPLKPIREVNEFFEKNYGKEFLSYANKEDCIRHYDLRIKYAHYFRDKCGRNKNFYTVLNKLGIYLQKIFHRTSKIDSNDFYFGSAYFDITEDLTDYILSSEKEIIQAYKYTSCCDEAFIHSIVWNSKYKERLFIPALGNGLKGNMRWVDMARGVNAGAYVIREADIDDIVKSGLLFARKFDFENYPEAIEKLENVLNMEK